MNVEILMLVVIVAMLGAFYSLKRKNVANAGMNLAVTKAKKKKSWIWKIGIFVIMVGITVNLLELNQGTNKDSASLSVQNKTEKKAPITKINYLMTTQHILQGVYKDDSEKKGVGVPEVDCSFADHWENDVDGLVYVKGSFILAGLDKVKHSYSARYGSGTGDIVYLFIDGEKIFYDDVKQTNFMDKFSEKNNK